MEMTALDHHAEDCSRVSAMLARVGDRWTLPVVVALVAGPLRFNAMRRSVSGVSQQMLTRTLRALERDGMVVRTVYPTVPPQVEYDLTDLGRSLAGEGLRLGAWVQGKLPEIERARADFDAREHDPRAGS